MSQQENNLITSEETFKQVDYHHHSEEFIPVDDVEVMNNNQQGDESTCKVTTTSDAAMIVDEVNNAAVYEKKIPKALIKLKEIFPDEFDFDELKNKHGLSKHQALGDGIEKVIVQEGSGLEATPGSSIRYLEACVVFFKRTEYSDWEFLISSNTLLQENRLKVTKVPPIFLKCIHTLKLGERAFFKIHKDLYPELKVTRLDPIQDDVECDKLIDLLKCYDYFGVQYINMAFLELKDVPPPKAGFSEHLELIVKKRLEGNVLFKEHSFAKALKTYNTGIIFVNEAKLDEGKFEEQKAIIREERIKLLTNIVRCQNSLNTEKYHKLCLDSCDKILFYDSENYNAFYFKAKTYNTLDDYSRGLEFMEKAKHYFSIYQQKNITDPIQQKKDAELKSRMEIIERQLLKKKKLQEEKDNKHMKSKMSNMFSEELYADVEPYDEEEYWRKQQEEDERLGRKPWFMSDGTIHYQQL